MPNRRCGFVVAVLGMLLSAAGLPAEDAGPNVLLICVDDLRPELRCFDKSYVHSPNIDRLAAAGRPFHRHYVQAPTCGASRYTLLTGRYGPAGNGALFGRAAQLAKNPQAVPLSLPGWFRKHGYTTVSVGKVSHHPGGRGGKDWDDPQQIEMPGAWDRHRMPVGPWRHPRGAMHGLANGEIRIKAGEMDVLQATAGPDLVYPDGLIVQDALAQLEQLAAARQAKATDGGEAPAEAGKPFFLAVGIIRPHLPFGAPKKYWELYRDVELPKIPHPTRPEGKTTWHGSGEFMKYNRWGRNPNQDAEFATMVRKHYAACVSYADSLVGQLLGRLDELKLRDDTIVVLWGDHGWHLGEHAIWGKHALFEESLRSPLIISYRGIPNAGEPTDSIVETLDVFPTLCDLAGLPQPEFVDGVSLLPILRAPEADGHPAASYARARTLRTDTHRLILHGDGHVELYDHRQDDAETRNVAGDHPELVERLTAELKRRLD